MSITLHVYLNGEEVSGIPELLTSIQQGVLMANATLAEIKAEIVQIRAGIDTANAANATVVADLKTQIQALKDQIAAGTAVTQQDLNEIDTGLDDIIAVQGGTPPAPPDQV